MISMQQVQWPWQRIARDRRPYILLALFLISMSGLVTGIALRPLTAQWWPTPNGGTTPPSTSILATTTTATLVPTSGPVAPQKFNVAIDPVQHVAPGSTFTVIAHTTLAKTGKPAPGVTCQLTFDAATHIPPSAKLITDTRGSATWSITIPASAPAGTYPMTLIGKWGAGFSTTWEVTVTVG